MIKHLLKKIRRKDEESERVIFEMFYERVYYTAYYILKDRELAQDVVQETFVKAFAHMDTVKDGEKLGAWLAAIASRTAIDYVRKIKRWNEIVTEDVIINEQIIEQASTVESIVEERALKELLLKEIDELKPDHKQVLILKYLYDMKYEEIAQALDLNIATVKSRTHRAKLKLREALEKQPDLREEIISNAKIW
ncbi:RNA polymerase sigma factor [Bacillus sp. FJAT-50079]|nr:RNA polymerase sigma factor [Bacillus sp. FJAT-50079]